MAERREGTSTGGDITHSFADDNVARGEPGVDFIKRRPTYPIGDDPRGREIDFEAEAGSSEAYGSTRNLVFRAYRGQAPLEGQDFGAPARIGKLQSISDLRPELPNRSVDTAALDRQKELDRATLEATDFAALFPSVQIDSPSPGATFSPGENVEIRATVTSLRNITSATLFIDNQPINRIALPRRDQDVATRHQFFFLYTVPADRALGSMDITVRGFNINTSAQGIIADDARNFPPQDDDKITGVGTLDGRLGQSHGSQAKPPLLEQTYLLRTPEGVASISVLIV